MVDVMSVSITEQLLVHCELYLAKYRKYLKHSENDKNCKTLGSIQLLLLTDMHTGGGSIGVHCHPSLSTQLTQKKVKVVINCSKNLGV